MKLVIIDTGCANLNSVRFAFERLGLSPIVSDNTDVISGADKLVLPGVGSAPYAMRNIEHKNLRQVISSVKQPLLGICLGMQLLFDTLSEGQENTQGLGLIPGKVSDLNTHNLPSPHMGWNRLEIVKEAPLLNGLSSGDYAYFVHSYVAPLSDATLAKSSYGDGFSAVVGRKNVYGCQFHPERSSAVGAKILENFAGLQG